MKRIAVLSLFLLSVFAESAGAEPSEPEQDSPPEQAAGLAAGDGRSGSEGATSGSSTSGSAAASTSELDGVLGAADCRDDAIADPRFVADLKNAVRPLIHEEDAAAMLTNKRHVVMAYAALLALLVAFVVGLALRQGRLAREIQRLEHDLEAALKE